MRTDASGGTLATLARTQAARVVLGGDGFRFGFSDRRAGAIAVRLTSGAPHNRPRHVLCHV